MNSAIPINLAVEGSLDEEVLRKILRQARRGYVIGTSYGRRGSGYLRRTIHGFNSAARGTPFAVLTDLDRETCPAELIRAWLPQPRHPNFLFRVAVSYFGIPDYAAFHRLKGRPDCNTIMGETLGGTPLERIDELGVG